MTQRALAALRISGVESDLLTIRYRCDEGISRLFEATIEVASEDPGLTFDALALQPARLALRGLTSTRYVHGIVRQLEHLRAGLHHTFYRVTLAPRAYRLTLRQDMRIFQQRSTPEIAREVLLAAGLHADEFRLDVVRDHPGRDYCVQYRETDLDFLHRILAREGLFYFFEHGEERSAMVFADHPKVHTSAPGQTEPLVRDEGVAVSHERIITFTSTSRLTPGKVTVRDFDALRPTLPVEVDLGAGPDQDLEIYEFPGTFVEEGLPFLGLGTDAAASALAEAQSGCDTSQGESDCPLLTAGHSVSITGLTPGGDPLEFVITHLVHEGAQPDTAQVDTYTLATYRNRFSCVPTGTAVPLPRSPRRPQIPSLQSAIVVGPEGETIHCDEHGRIKVHFHWDRVGKSDEHASCWVRVMHPWGGDQHGFLSVPRIGTEVAVGFLEGDPDRPVVLGCLYSGEIPPPHPLPGAKTRTALRSRSVPGSGFNELCFEDSAGAEAIFLRAERDLNVRVGHDLKTSVDGRAHTTVGEVRSCRVGADHLTVDDNQVTEVGGHAVSTVGGSLVFTADALLLDVQRGVCIRSASDISLNASGVLVLSAPGGVCLRAGGSFITIAADGVSIQGPTIALNGGGKALDAAAPPTPETERASAPVAADEP